MTRDLCLAQRPCVANGTARRRCCGRCSAAAASLAALMRLLCCYPQLKLRHLPVDVCPHSPLFKPTTRPVHRIPLRYAQARRGAGGLPLEAVCPPGLARVYGGRRGRRPVCGRPLEARLCRAVSERRLAVGGGRGLASEAQSRGGNQLRKLCVTPSFGQKNQPPTIPFTKPPTPTATRRPAGGRAASASPPRWPVTRPPSRPSTRTDVTWSSPVRVTGPPGCGI
jgi:hypothetical protein